MAIHTIQRTLTVSAPLVEYWRFFTNPRNFIRITPPALGAKMKPGECVAARL
jgi:ligand-binding SRPBCC domain-containing protein